MTLFDCVGIFFLGGGGGRGILFAANFSFIMDRIRKGQLVGMGWGLMRRRKTNFNIISIQVPCHYYNNGKYVIFFHLLWYGTGCWEVDCSSSMLNLTYFKIGVKVT